MGLFDIQVDKSYSHQEQDKWGQQNQPTNQQTNKQQNKSWEEQSVS